MPSQALEELVSPNTNDRHRSLHYSLLVESAGSQQPLTSLSLHSAPRQQAYDEHCLRSLRRACIYGRAQCRNKRRQRGQEKRVIENKRLDESRG